MLAIHAQSRNYQTTVAEWRGTTSPRHTTATAQSQRISTQPALDPRSAQKRSALAIEKSVSARRHAQGTGRPGEQPDALAERRATHARSEPPPDRNPPSARARSSRTRHRYQREVCGLSILACCAIRHSRAGGRRAFGTRVGSCLRALRKVGAGRPDG